MLHLKDSTGLLTGVEGMEEDCAPPLLGGSSSKFGGGKGGRGFRQDMGEHWKAPKKWEHI